jgi:hypothetical protein
LYQVVLWQWFNVRNITDMILNSFHRHCYKTYTKHTTSRKQAAFVMVFRCIRVHNKRDREQVVTSLCNKHAKDGLETGMNYGVLKGRIGLWFEAHLNKSLIYIVKKKWRGNLFYPFWHTIPAFLTSWSSGQSFWLMSMWTRVRFLVLPWGFFLEGEDSHGDCGLGSLVELRFKDPLGTSYSYITVHLIGTT